MTDWIDGLVASLSDDQKRENVRNTLALVHADLIAKQGPQFTLNLSSAARELARELDEKLGATLGRVRFQERSEGGWAVENDGVKSVTLSCHVNLKSRQIQVTTSMKHPSVVLGDGARATYSFKIGDSEDLYAEGPLGAFHEGPDLASALLRDAFKPELLRA